MKITHEETCPMCNRTVKLTKRGTAFIHDYVEGTDSRTGKRVYLKPPCEMSKKVFDKQSDFRDNSQ